MNTGTVLPYWVHDEQLLDAFIKGCEKLTATHVIAEAMDMTAFSLVSSIKYIRNDYVDHNYTPEQEKVAGKLLELWDHADTDEVALKVIEDKLDQALAKQK